MAPPIDEKLLSQQALDLLPSDDRGFRANSPFLLMGVAVGPAQSILSPSQIEDNGFATELRRESLYGPTPIFDRAKGTSAKVLKGALMVSQPNGAQIRLDPGANIAFKIPLPLAPPRQDKPSAIYEEDVELALKNMMSFAKYMLDHVDDAQRLTHVAIALKMFGTDMMVWCKKGDANAQSLSVRPILPPPQRDAICAAVIPRAALADAIDVKAQGFIPVLKRQARWQ